MIETLSETGSTNADLAARMAAGEFPAEGHWLIADRQTAGRGRHGRIWFDGSGNFMGSTIVRPGPGDPPPASLALLAGLAVHEVVSALLPPPHRAMLKWPNDVLVGGAKLAGILLEAAGGAVIVGIGVNLTRAPQLEGRETVGLAAFGPPPERDLFAQALARQFDLELKRWRSVGLAPLIARWLAAGHPSGTPLMIGEPDEEAVAAEFIGLATDGALQVRLPDGTARVIHAGEVRLAEH